MKPLKLSTISVMIISICILSGCSDIPVSTETNNQIITGMTGRGFEYGTFRKKYILKHGETINLSWNITGLILTNSYIISNCTINAQGFIHRHFQSGWKFFPAMHVEAKRKLRV